jgi:hypothetical protein
MGTSTASITTASITTNSIAAATTIARHGKSSRVVTKKLASISIYILYNYYARNGTNTISLLYSNKSRSSRQPASNRSKLKSQAMILYPSYGNLISSVLLGPYLTPAYPPLVPNSCASDHVFRFSSLWHVLLQHGPLGPSRGPHSSSPSPSLVPLTWSIGELWLRYLFWPRIDYVPGGGHVRQRRVGRHR